MGGQLSKKQKIQKVVTLWLMMLFAICIYVLYNVEKCRRTVE